MNKTIGETFHRHVVRHSHVGGDTDHDHLKMAIEACGGRGDVTAPEPFLSGIAPLALMVYESMATDAWDAAVKLAECVIGYVGRDPSERALALEVLASERARPTGASGRVSAVVHDQPPARLPRKRAVPRPW